MRSHLSRSFDSPAVRWRRCAGALLLVVATLVPAHDQAYAAVVDDIRTDAEWIMSARLSDGAIANYIDKQAIWPYLSNFAAMGLARATEITKDKRYVTAAWSWLSWYRAHMDAQGFVTDYVVKEGKAVSTGFMDSTDAYAGTYLTALRDVYRANPDLGRLRTFGNSIALAVRAMEATQTADGLTWAKPTWKVKYLMDQAEVYAGFRAAAELAQGLRDSLLTTRALRGADRVRAGVARLWNTATAAYDWAVHSDGARVTTDWTYMYSDSLQQIWAVAFGLVPSPSDASLAARFITRQPSWASPTARALFSGGVTETVGYWPVAALGLHRVKNPAGISGADRIRQTALAAKRLWPYTTATAGQVILTQAMTLRDARLLDVSTAVSGTYTTTSTQPTGSVSPTPSASPQTTASTTPSPAPSTPAPTPSGVNQSVGPVNVGVSVTSDGASVSASTTPTPSPSPGRRTP